MHHSNQSAIRETDRQRMELAAQQMKLGATGHQLMPPVSHDDVGEIAMAISHDPTRRKVYFNFGKPVAWLGLTPEQASDIGQSLIEHSQRCRGIEKA